MNVDFIWCRQVLKSEESDDMLQRRNNLFLQLLIIYKIIIRFERHGIEFPVFLYYLEFHLAEPIFKWGEKELQDGLFLF